MAGRGTVAGSLLVAAALGAGAGFLWPPTAAETLPEPAPRQDAAAPAAVSRSEDAAPGPRLPGAPPPDVAGRIGEALHGLLHGEDDMGTRGDALESLFKAVADWQEEAGMADPLAAHGWWRAALRATMPRSTVPSGFLSTEADWFGDAVALSVWVPPSHRVDGPPHPLIVAVLDDPGSPLDHLRGHYGPLMETHVIVGVHLKAREEAEADLLVEDPGNALLGLRWATEHLRIDRDRVVLDGFGRGEGVVRAVVGDAARELQGVVLRNPATRPEPVGNLDLFPVLLVHHVRAPTPVMRTAYDLAERLQGVEVFEAGPDDPRFLKMARDICSRIGTLPPRALADPAHEYEWYTLSGPTLRRGGHRFVLHRVDGAGSGRLVRVRWRANRETNTIELETDNVAVLELLLDDGVLDLGQPVGVTVNGVEVARVRVDRDLETLVDWAQQAGTLVTATLKVRIPAEARGR